VKYIVATVLMVMLLIASASALPDAVTAEIVSTAEGTNVVQVGANVAFAGGDDAQVSESVDQTAVASGLAVQVGANAVILSDGEGQYVEQSLNQEAEAGTATVQAGGNVVVGTILTPWGGNNNGLTVNQDTNQVANATDGPAVQIAGNVLVAGGNGISATQTQTMQARSASWVIPNTGISVGTIQAGLNGAVIVGNNANINQTATASTYSEGSVLQLFANIGEATGTGTDYTQVIQGYANTSYDPDNNDFPIGVIQVGINDAGVGNALIGTGPQNGVTANQSVIYTGEAADSDVAQVGANAFIAQDNAVLGQEVDLGAEGENALQAGINFGAARNDFTANQFIAENVTSTGAVTFQLAGNLFADTATFYAPNVAGDETNSSLAQGISGGSYGAGTAIQVFGNIAYLNRWPAGGNEDYQYTVSQSNIADAEADTGVLQIQPNLALWETSATGGWGAAINGHANAPTVIQIQPNILIPV